METELLYTEYLSAYDLGEKAHPSSCIRSEVAVGKSKPLGQIWATITKNERRLNALQKS